MADKGADLAGVGENDETPVPSHPGLDDHWGPRWRAIRTPIGLEAKFKLGILDRSSLLRGHAILTVAIRDGIDLLIRRCISQV